MADEGDDDKDINAPLKRMLKAQNEIMSLERLHSGDEITIIAWRIAHAVTVAGTRNDLPSLREWERPMRDYMLTHAKGDYLAMWFDARTGADRHIVLDGLKRNIAYILALRTIPVEEARRQFGPIDPMVLALIARRPFRHRPFEIAGLVAVMIHRNFAWLKPDFILDDDVTDAVTSNIVKRYKRRAENQREIKPEQVLLDGLRAFGLTKDQAHGWLNPLKKR